MVAKSINDSIGPVGVVPAFYLFVSLPRRGLPTDGPTPSTLERAVSLRKATTAMSKHFASRQIRDAFKTRKDPDVSKIHRTPIGAHMLVYGLEKDKWDGSY